MNQKYRNIIMWVLYGLVCLLVMLVQTTVFGRVRFLGVKLSLMPMAMVCIGLWTEHEAAGLFGLVAGLCWCALGADDGALSIVTFPVIAILSGWLCDSVFARHLLPALLMSLGALLLHEGLAFLVKLYLGSAPAALAVWVPRTAALSLLACPALYLLAKLIRKAGGSL